MRHVKVVFFLYSNKLRSYSEFITPWKDHSGICKIIFYMRMNSDPAMQYFIDR
jgi:hypothetical protein